MQVTVLGATGGIGRAITHELHQRGHDVRPASRSGGTVLADVPSATFDQRDRASTTAACRGADVVVMAAQPPYHDWIAQWPGIVDNVLAACEEVGARLVFVDNLYMYAPADGPLTEASPEHATDPKGMLRRKLGETLLAAHEAGRVRVAIGRFSDYYGPGGTNSGLHMMGIKPALAGRRPRGLWNLDQPHTFHYLPDAARGFATLVDDDRADGHVWVLPAAPAITQGELLALVSDATGAKAPGVLSHAMIWLGGVFDPVVRESRSVRVQFDRPWVVDATRFQDTFGRLEVTPHRQAVAATVRSFRAEDSAPPATGTREVSA